jgi:hypothetical protein
VVDPPWWLNPTTSIASSLDPHQVLEAGVHAEWLIDPETRSHKESADALHASIGLVAALLWLCKHAPYGDTLRATASTYIIRML